MLTKQFISTLILTSLTASSFVFAQTDAPPPAPVPAPSAPAPATIKDLTSGDYYLDKTHASLIFKVNHLGLSNYTMRFTDFDAVLSYNQADPTKSKVDVNINPLSIKTDYPDPAKVNFDQELSTKAEWLNTTKFSTITYKSKTVLISEDNKTAVIYGDLTMLGVSKPVTLNATLNGVYKLHPMTQLPSMGFSATAEFNRSDWGMNYLTPNVGDLIKVIIEVEFNKKVKD